MPPPPPGCVSAGAIGDKPLNAKADYYDPSDTVYVCCVLVGDWPGSSQAVRDVMPDLGAHYVRVLYQMVARYAPLNRSWRFVCFTDRPEIPGVPTKPIPRGMYSYFNKLYCFSPEAFPLGARVLFLDLDTCLVANWAPLADVPLDKIVMLRDIWADDVPASGVMSWRVSPETHAIWREFEPIAQSRPPYQTTRPAARRAPAVKIFKSGQPASAPAAALLIRTDEHFLHQFVLPDRWAAWQDLLPGMLVSYKYHLQRTMRGSGPPLDKMTPEEARKVRVVFFHGLPRPHTVVARWNPFPRGVLTDEQLNWKQIAEDAR